MRMRRLLVGAAAAALAPAIVPLAAHGDEPPTLAASNGIYTIAVRNGGQPGAGTFSVSTGPSNPFGTGISLLYGGGAGAADTTWASVRAFDSSLAGHRDYTQGQRIDDFSTIEMDDDTTVEPLGDTGLLVTHDMSDRFPGFILEEALAIEGTTFEDSVVVVDLTLTNTQLDTASFGLRQLLDLAVGADDGPTFQQGDDAATTQAATYGSPTPFRWRYADNDVGAEPLPTFEVVAETFPRPQLLQYACDAEATRFPFSYQIHSAVEVASPSAECVAERGGDSAVLTYWGVDEAHAITLAPGETFTATQTLQIAQVRPIPTRLTGTPVLLRLNPFGLSLTTLHARATTPAGVPIVGRQITFSAGGSQVCSAVTTAGGDATCTGLASSLTAILNLGFTARFAGDATYAPAQAGVALIG